MIAAVRLSPLHAWGCLPMKEVFSSLVHEVSAAAVAPVSAAAAAAVAAAAAGYSGVTTIVRQGLTLRADSQPFSRFLPPLQPTAAAAATAAATAVQAAGSTEVRPCSAESPEGASAAEAAAAEKTKEDAAAAINAGEGAGAAAAAAAEAAAAPDAETAAAVDLFGLLNRGFPRTLGGPGFRWRPLKGSSSTTAAAAAAAGGGGGPHANLDEEGRALLTEHSGCIIVNVYTPASGLCWSRLAFKLHFLHALRALLIQQR